MPTYPTAMRILDGWTDRNGESGDEGESARTSAPPDTTNGHRAPSDYDAIREELATRDSLTAKVTIREIWVPPIAAGPDDDIEDIDPRWRQ
jgi:hypothetical protein